ncbi:hypothetical protein B0H17DRAFT_1139809 [Mycena rosella]|uniref:Uncharacterized protein n=1 Tax=Mycena rosella TaxID=1033263 RepID=A0AAD7GCL7_MYCRO|nr:hypothetical protein B0H17DRAFT_1139809 [Mycena rosella]
MSSAFGVVKESRGNNAIYGAGTTTTPRFKGRRSVGGGGGGPVETRKLLQRFRQFLTDEERFWHALVLPTEVTLPPELVGVPAAADVGVGARGAGNEDDGMPEDRMNHFGFPPASAAEAEAVQNKYTSTLGLIYLPPDLHINHLTKNMWAFG